MKCHAKKIRLNLRGVEFTVEVSLVLLDIMGTLVRRGIQGSERCEGVVGLLDLLRSKGVSVGTISFSHDHNDLKGYGLGDFVESSMCFVASPGTARTDTIAVKRAVKGAEGSILYVDDDNDSASEACTKGGAHIVTFGTDATVPYQFDDEGHWFMKVRNVQELLQAVVSID